MKLHDESAAVKFLGLFNVLTVEARSETKLVRYLTNHFFGSLQFQKKITYEGHLFFQSVQNLM